MERSRSTSTGCCAICKGTAYLAAKRQYSRTLCDGRALVGRVRSSFVCPRVCIRNCRGGVDRIDESQAIHPIADRGTLSVGIAVSAIFPSSRIGSFRSHSLACEGARNCSQHTPQCRSLLSALYSPTIFPDNY